MAGRMRRIGAAGAAGLLIASVACTGDDGGDGGAEGEVRGEGDAYEAVIRRTEGGVPHITGDTLADVTFGQGWASGEDRTCDLADQILKVRGERARWFGPGEDDRHLDSDFAWRTIGLFERATADWNGDSGDNRPSDDTRELFTAFADGWNAHLADVGVDGLSGWCAGAEWVRPIEPVELYAYARSVALLASGANPQLVQAVADARPPDEPAPEEPAAEDEAALPGSGAGQLGSNGWAIGAERSANGHGMLVANPHFPWEGELRFWEVHLTVPGELDAYGVQLSGLPGIGIGFNEHIAWTHTVSAGNRFTAYRLDLVPGSPTTYVYGDEQREMTATDITVEVLGEDGEVAEQTRTLWSTHYGPVISVPSFGVGWTEEMALTYRDANVDDDEIVPQYQAMIQAESLDDLIAVHEEHAGVPLFNTIAASADGRAWYADTSATPNLSDAGLAAYDQAKQSDPLVAAAADQGLVLLDGSDPVFEWEDEDGARDPGLVPVDELPQVERADYVFNANDSFWMPHAREMLEGDYSPLHGAQRTPRSPRTRENATVLDGESPEGPAGEDGAFTLDELADAALLNQGFMARQLLDDVVARCEAAPSTTIQLAELPGDEGTDNGLPAASVDIGEACAVLAQWDGVYDLDRSGPPLWREMLSRFGFADLLDAGELWAEPFDAAEPLATPSGLATPPAGAPDPVLEALARAVQILDVAGIPVDTTLGDVQFALRDGERIPIHGGTGRDGTTNVVGGSGGLLSTADPDIPAFEAGEFAPQSPLGRFGDEVGYGINNGTSFLLVLAFTDDGPVAKAFLTYGNTEDRSRDEYTEATQRFSDKDWRDVLFAAAEIDDAALTTVTVRG